MLEVIQTLVVGIGCGIALVALYGWLEMSWRSWRYKIKHQRNPPIRYHVDEIILHKDYDRSRWDATATLTEREETREAKAYGVGDHPNSALQSLLESDEIADHRWYKF